MSEREDREAFETFWTAKFPAYGPLYRKDSGAYVNRLDQCAWLGWQAALRYERERTKESGNAE